MSMYGGYPAAMPIPGTGPALSPRFPPYPVAGSAHVVNTDSSWDNEMHELIRGVKSLLANADIEELQEIDNDEGKLMSLIEDSTQLKNLKSKRMKALNENKDLAAVNLSMKPELQIKREKLLSVIQQQLSLKDEYDRLKRQFGLFDKPLAELILAETIVLTKLNVEVSGSYSLEKTSAILKASASEAEEETEALSQKLLDDEVGFDDFLDKYLAKRTLYHIKRIKADKLSELVMKTPTYYGSGYGRY